MVERLCTSDPLFVVGMNGSGTSMMLNHLGQHPDLYAFPAETYILPYFLNKETAYGDLKDDRTFEKLWLDMGSSFVFRFRNKGRVPELPQDWRQAERSVAGVFDGIMRGFAQSENKAHWSEKTPMHVLHIAQIADAYPEARFIHMLRDGRDCAASDERRWKRHPVGTIYRWKHAVQEGRRQGGTIGERYLEIRYEDVIADPENSLRAACKFAALEFDRAVLAVENARQHMTGQESKTIVRRGRTFRDYFPDRRVRQLESVAGKRLAEFGYPVLFEHGDRTPSVIARGGWTLHDGFFTFARHLRGRLTTQRRMSWSLMVRRWAMILRSKFASK